MATRSEGSSAASTTHWLAPSRKLRLTRRVAAIVAASLGVTAVAAELSGAKARVEAWSTGTAYAAYFLLALSMALGPLRVIRKQHNPVHNAMRRDIGISAGVAALIHTVLGLQVHLGGDLRKYFLLPPDAGKMAYAFVGTNWIGLLSSLILLVLVIISNNISIRAIGLERWKNIQRIAYFAVAAAIVHGIIYQVIENRNVLVLSLVSVIAIAILILQLAGWRAASQR